MRSCVIVYGTVRYGTVRYGTVLYGTSTGTVRYYIVRYLIVLRYGTFTVRYGPDLFIFFMAVVMKTWRSSQNYNLCCIHTKAVFQLTRRKHRNKGEWHNISDSEYADDTVFIFESRTDCERMAPLMAKHFDRWGLEVHVGTKINKESKSEVLFLCCRSQILL